MPRKDTPSKSNSKTPRPEKPEDGKTEAESAEPEAPKPDPARYGDWTVNGIAVDF